LRQEVCDRLAYLGVVVDPVRNRQTTGESVAALHAPESRVEVWVIPTDEGQVAAREASRLLAQAAA